MRYSRLALGAALVLTATAVAQEAPPRLPSAPAQPVAPAAPVDPALDSILQRWERQMQGFKTLALQLTRTDEDRTLGSVLKQTGIAYFMKDGTGRSARNLVLLQTSRVGSSEIAEKFICTGTYFYQFSPSNKQIEAHELPRTAPGAMPDDNILGMFGLRAEDAKRRYSLKLIKEDDYYYYLEITPRFRRDLEEFVWARVVLNKSSMLPRQLQYTQPNKNQTVWDFPPSGVQINQKMDVRWFDKPTPPPGWKLVDVRPGADAPPKIYRNSGAP